jgi:hypothetical protein
MQILPKCLPLDKKLRAPRNSSNANIRSITGPILCCSMAAAISVKYPIAHGDPLQPHVPRNDRSQRHIHVPAGRCPDQTYRASGPDGAKRLRQRCPACDVNDIVDAFAACDFTRPLAPLRDLATVVGFSISHRIQEAEAIPNLD